LGSHTELTVVIPTLNERGNIKIVVDSLDAALQGISWEVVFVDDFSSDGTPEAVRSLAAVDRRVRLIERHNRRGLSSAVVEGALAASADIVAVMDGDLQHDETLLPRLYAEVAEGKADVASASRFLRENDAQGLSSERRKKLSQTGIRLSNAAFGLDMSDPLTGFFVVRRDVVVRALPRLSELGFKILLDILTAAEPRPRVVELPFSFRERAYGESKLSKRVLYDFFLFFIEKKIRPYIPLPAQFISFSLINSIGILVHVVVYSLLMSASMAFGTAQLVATVFAMAFNYYVNNEVTYGQSRLSGNAFYLGFIIFALVCSVGVVANVGVAVMMHDRYSEMTDLIPVVFGAMISVVWNYGATRYFVWRNSAIRRASNSGLLSAKYTSATQSSG
jgi:dolichol-phosphate mannosyltransferase